MGLKWQPCGRGRQHGGISQPSLAGRGRLAIGGAVLLAQASPKEDPIHRQQRLASWVLGTPLHVHPPNKPQARAPCTVSLLCLCMCVCYTQTTREHWNRC